MDINVNEFEDKLLSGKMSRRRAMSMLAAAGVMSLTVPMGSRRAMAAPEDHPVVYTWGGYDDKAFMMDYVNKYGEEPRFSLFTDEDSAYAKMNTGFQPDMMYPCNQSIKKWYDAGLLAPIDLDLIPNWQDTIEPMKNIPDSTIDGKRVFVSGDWGQTSIMFREDLAPEYADNHSWEILWDEKYAGRVAMFDSVADTVVIAGMLSGVDPFDMSDDDMEKVRTKLEAQLPLNRLLANDRTSMSQALVSGEVVASSAWNSFIYEVQSAEAEMKSGGKFTYMKPKEGRTTWVCGLTIHPNALKNGMYEKCHELINAMISADAGHYELTNWYYGVANKNAYTYDDVTPELLEAAGISNDPAADMASGLFLRGMKREAEIATMYEELKAELGL